MTRRSSMMRAGVRRATVSVPTITTLLVGFPSTGSPTHKLALTGGSSSQSITIAFQLNSATNGVTRVVEGYEADASLAFTLGIAAGTLELIWYNNLASTARYVSATIGSTSAFWVVRFRNPGVTIANGDVEIYRDGTLQTPAINDNYLSADANTRDFALFTDYWNTDFVLGIGQLSVTLGWQAPTDYYDGSKPRSFASMTPAPIIALGDDMTVANWNAGVNRGSGGTLTRTGTPDLVAGTPTSINLA